MSIIQDPKMLERFNQFWNKLLDKQKSRRLLPIVSAKNKIENLTNQLEKLEQILYFMFISNAYEGVFTPELREAIRRARPDLYDLYMEWENTT